MIDEGGESYLKFLEGDETCFEKLVILYRNSMTDFINQIISDFHCSEEIAEDVFVMLYVKKPRYIPIAGFKTWLYSIAKNKARNYLKMKNRLSVVELPPDKVHSESPDQILCEIYLDERKIALHRALDELPSDYKLVLHLYYFDSLSVKEIAAILGKRSKMISDALYNAKKSLRAVIMKGEKYEILRGNNYFDS